MTVWTLAAGAAPLVLVPGMIVKLEAISPTTGLAVAGVTATRWAIYGRTDDGGDADAPQFESLPPLLTYEG